MAKKTNDGSRIAGIRQAKAQFSALVHDASNGREWVSERGVPVARPNAALNLARYPESWAGSACGAEGAGEAAIRLVKPAA